MNSVMVFRVENAAGIGPYQANNRDESTLHSMILLMMRTSHNDMSTHPNPQSDKGLWSLIRENEVCAFTSIAQMQEWFRGYGRDLSACDYRVNVYSVPADSVRSGDKQCLVLARDVMQEDAIHTFNPSSVIP